MLRIFQLVKNLVLSKRLDVAEDERQKAGGYILTAKHAGPEIWFEYQEGDRQLDGVMDYINIYGDVRVFKNSFLTWNEPMGEELTPYEYEKVLNRVVRYFERGGCKVILDDTYIPTLEEEKEDLRKQGIPFEEHNGILHYSLDLDEPQNRAHLNKFIKR